MGRQQPGYRRAGIKCIPQPRLAHLPNSPRGSTGAAAEKQPHLQHIHTETQHIQGQGSDRGRILQVWNKTSAHQPAHPNGQGLDCGPVVRTHCGRSTHSSDRLTPVSHNTLGLSESPNPESNHTPSAPHTRLPAHTHVPVPAAGTGNACSDNSCCHLLGSTAAAAAGGQELPGPAAAAVGQELHGRAAAAAAPAAVAPAPAAAGGMPEYSQRECSSAGWSVCLSFCSIRVMCRRYGCVCDGCLALRPHPHTFLLPIAC